MRLAAATRVLRGTVPESAILPLLFPQLRTAPPTLGTRQLLQAYAEMPWFRAVCDKTADAVASVRWRVLAVKPQGQTRFVRPLGIQRAGFLERAKRLKTHQLAGEVVEILEHPLLQLMHEANPWFTGGEHRKLTQIYLDSVGEAGWIKERNGAGAPMAVWPLPPHWVRELPSPARPFFTVAVDRQPFTLPLSEVIWFKHAHPVNPFGRGTGIGGALGDELETDEYAARHLKQWFFNSARPDLIVTMEGASEPELRRAEQHWLDRHQGFWRAFKPFFANRKAEVKEIGQSFRDMQLTQLRDQERDVITQVFGVPPEIFGIIENSNRSTVDAADFLMAKHVTIPRLEFIREPTGGRPRVPVEGGPGPAGRADGGRMARTAGQAPARAGPGEGVPYPDHGRGHHAPGRTAGCAARCPTGRERGGATPWSGPGADVPRSRRGRRQRT